ncbi:hypothetical protein GCM10027046_13390 [Uliginosibacterium flavum]|uniref:DksA C4-type domain-containing protein n=1 Tax=Uliginosibacterium flavum TaxID=1396831 RepID=A0ABV2TPZ9_9RHOO
MHKVLEDLLYARYPDIFRERALPPEASAMGRGCTCGDGWFAIIDAVCEQIADSVTQGEMPTVTFRQIKEKVGSLRIHFRGGDAHTRTLVRLAEAFSIRICKECGAPTDIHDVSYSRPSQLCKACNAALTSPNKQT